ncbi:MAG TPA: PAS domain S-box protein [Noviherbaspirillum sp.]|nr:PAS domain S-box protein [Noviherbaspirillum sp.]
MPEASILQQASSHDVPQERLDRLVRNAQRLTGTSIAFLVMGSADELHFIAQQGLGEAELQDCKTFCACTPDGDAPLIVENAADNPRFAALPLVAGAPHLRFYAGWPLMDRDGRRLGTLAVLDPAPRTLSPAEREALHDLALWATSEFDRHVLRRGLASAREHQARLHTVIHNMAEGIITLDERGQIVSMNRAAIRIFGYEPDEVIGQSINLLMPNKYHQTHDGYLQKFRDTGKTRVIGLDREVTGRRKDGSQFAMAITVNEMWLNGRRGFAGIVRDVSEHRDNERKLRETSALLQAVMSSTAAFVYVRDLEGRFMFINKEYERVFNVTSEQVLGKTLDELFPAALAEHNRVKDRAVLEGGDSSRLEDELRLEDGRRTFLVVRKPLVNERGEVYGVCGVGTDITLRKQAEQFKNEFISTVSHELRTPLTSIRGSLGLLIGGVAGDMPERAKTLLDIAHNNCERLVRLINDILDIEKIESGHMRFDMSTQHLLPLVEQAIAATRDYAAQFDVTFELQADAADAVVNADGDRIVQVIVNLLSNAAKFSPHGSRVQLRLAHHAGGVRLSVIDRGPGISEEFRPRIFQKFAQADSSNTRQKGGTGLGLSISRAIIERHHGSIGFHSMPGKGTEFYFDLPSSVTGESSAPQRGRVLVCEDDPDIARLLAMMLQQAGMHSDVVHDAEQARRQLMQGHYEAMTLDLSLPREDGLSLLRWIRAQDKTHDLPVVVVSARAEEGRKELTGGAVGIIDWIQKPIDEGRLVSALQNVIRSSKDSAPRVLYVEDDHDLKQVVAALLEPAYSLDHASTLAEAQEKLALECFSLILLDLHLADGHGSELLGSLPMRNAATPVVVFSAEEADAVTIDRVRAVLVKSRTSNEQLLAVLQELMHPAPKDR